MLFVCVLGHTYKRRSEGWSFSFLSDPTPIIVYPCQWLTPLVETWIMWLWLRMMPATRLPNKQNNTYQAKPCQVELWIDDWFETLTKAKELNSLAGVPLTMFILGEEEEREKLAFLWKFQPLRKPIGQPHLQLTKKWSKWKFLTTYLRCGAPSTCQQELEVKKTW